MQIDLTGKQALVTGSSRGTGLAIATGAAVAAAAADRARGDRHMCVHLASPLASATTGAAVRVDGGYVDAILP